MNLRMRLLCGVLIALSVLIASQPCQASQETTDKPSAYMALEVSWQGGPSQFVEVQRVTLDISTGQIPSYQGPSGALAFSSAYAGKSIAVTVQVLRWEGEQPPERVRQADYLLKPNETIEVKPFPGYVTAPLRIGIVPIAPETTPPPKFSNISNSLELAQIERLPSGFPRYKVTVRNVGTRPILALSQGTNGTTSNEVWDERNAALMEPGKEYSWTAETLTGKRAGGLFVPDAITTIDIGCVVFADGSYIGDRFQAFLAFESRACVRRLVAWTVDALKGAAASDEASTNTLKDSVSSLSSKLEDKDILIS
ncbi:MAG TPA: hypothetical protein VEZ90_02110 [Blastocatellia bacterium]|nr:hypothetical protein [Blastocatellia bacterium]